MTRNVYVLSAVRTPIGKFLGSFQTLSAVDLGVFAVQAAIERAGIDALAVDELFFGNGRQAGGGPNMARQVAFRAGCGENTPAATVNQACASGLLSIEMAADRIRLGRCEVIVAGGAESMSGLPFFLDQARTGYRLGHGVMVDGMYKDGFHCPLCDLKMGETAENLADQYSISRLEQDQYALRSQELCQEAIEEGRFRSEIVPVTVPRKRKEALVVQCDEHPRAGVTLDKLGKLPAVFRKEGTVHAGNSSGITDGAAALVLASEEFVRSHGLNPLASVAESATVGVDPAIMGIGPVLACRTLEKRSGISTSAYGVIELNEAFASQVLACFREMDLEEDRVNPNGGSIALGHPIGATGARIAGTLIHEMKRRQAENGLATLCVSGGMGIAIRFVLSA
ncbi:MAG: thiolase family protein [Planctomycetota bacterium]|nr:thiolase family protein [Planctomycetota bacterium]